MIIKSQFKDYYDYVAHVYGGGDPSIQYIRLPFTEISKPTYGSLGRDGVDVITSTDMLGFPRHLFAHNGKYEHHHLKWLSVNGYRYILVRIEPTGAWQVLDEIKHPKLWGSLTQTCSWDGSRNTTPATYHACFDKELVLISRKLNAPVFTYCVGVGYVSVDGEIPILKDIGFDKIANPEQLYQDISYFMGNIIKESPDMMPTTKMTDKEKIAQHGFDFKQSFRHRK